MLQPTTSIDVRINCNACSLGQQCPIDGSMRRITQTDFLLCILALHDVLYCLIYMHSKNSTGVHPYESKMIDSLGKCPDNIFIYYTMFSSPIRFDMYSDEITFRLLPRCSSLTYYTTASCVLLDRFTLHHGSGSLRTCYHRMIPSLVAPSSFHVSSIAFTPSVAAWA